MSQIAPPGPTTTVRGRYRHRPAPWLWAALVLIPLLAALLGLLGRGGGGPAASAPTAAPSSAATGGTAGWPVEVTGDKQKVTVTATVADEAAHQALYGAVKQGVGGAQIVDRISVQPGQPGTNAAGLSSVLGAATSKFEDFGVLVTDSAVQVRGAAPDQGTLDSVGQAAGGAFPGHAVSTSFTNGVASPTGPLTCPGIQGQIAARLAAHPVTFDHASSAVSATSRDRLTEIGKGLAACKSGGIVVRGHTDATGTTQINDKLSAQRAQAVRQVLLAAGVAADQVTSESVGSREPVTFNDTEDGRAQNRRVEIRVGSEGRG